MPGTRPESRNPTGRRLLTTAGSGGKQRPCLHLFILALVSLSILSPAFFATRSNFKTEIAASPTDGRSVYSVPVAVAAQEDQVLHSPLLPLTSVATQPAELPAPLPQQSPVPEMPAESIMAAAGVTSVRTQPTPLPAPPVYFVYTVQDGDTVDGLAARYGISASSILWSNLELESADSLGPGQYLRVPASDGVIYDVRPGDTLSDIADRFEVEVQAIIDFPGNNLKSADSIAENQAIFIPNGVMPVPAVTPTPEPLPESPSTLAPEPLPTPPAIPPDVSPSDIEAQAVELTRSRIGSPYVSGAAGPDGFDCSGLVYWVYSQLGLEVPRSTHEQFAWATPVEMSLMQPGDLVFFENTSSGGISHVGIYVGGGGVVMAVNNGDIVREVSLAEPYWSDHFAGAGRPP